MTLRRDGYATPPERRASATYRLSEDDLKARVIQTAGLYGWRVCHFRPARTAKGWRTPIEGDAGLPDLVLARDGRVLLVELKSARGKPTDDQVLWLEALGDHGRLWSPKQWDDGTIHTELRRTRP